MNTTTTRVAAAALGSVLLLGSASAAFAAEVDDDSVPVSVDIAPVQSGALTLSVAAGGSTLTEVASEDNNFRKFTGVLPTVTVTDDRSQVPEGVAWYVTGQASTLTSTDGDQIDAGNLGWTPKLLTSEGDGKVAEGAEVGTVLDSGPNNVGLKGEEFLSLSLDSGEAAEVGKWEANADLTLKTLSRVAPGASSGTITLTLWEDAY